MNGQEPTRVHKPAPSAPPQFKWLVGAGGETVVAGAYGPLLQAISNPALLVDRVGNLVAANVEFFKAVPAGPERPLSRCFSYASWTRIKSLLNVAEKAERTVLDGPIQLQNGTLVTNTLIAAAVQPENGRAPLLLVHWKPASLSPNFCVTPAQNAFAEEVSTLRKLAYQDELTGLANRRAFFRRLEAHLSALKAGTLNGIAILYFDLDDFKRVNDTGGHEAGDEVLRCVAQNAEAVLQEADGGGNGVVARLGGDDFAASIPVVLPSQGADIARAMSDAVKKVQVTLNGACFAARCSVGWTGVGAGDVTDDLTAKDLLYRADQSCMATKAESRGRSGSRRLRRFEAKLPDCDRVELGSNELRLETTAIRSASCGAMLGQIVSVCKVDRVAKFSSGPSALFDLENEVATWALDKALDTLSREECRQWLAVPLSVKNAQSAEVRQALKYRLARNPLLASRLCLMFEESCLAREAEVIREFVSFAKKLGCQIAVDGVSGDWSNLSAFFALKPDWFFIDLVDFGRIGSSGLIELLKAWADALSEHGIFVIAKTDGSGNSHQRARQTGLAAILESHTST